MLALFVSALLKHILGRRSCLANSFRLLRICWRQFLAVQLGHTGMLMLGIGAMVERLVSLNDYEHSMAWSVVSHPNNTNPFPGSYLNSLVHLSLKPVSMGNATFIKLSSSFSTEASHKELMETTFRRLYESAVINVQRWGLPGHIDHPVLALLQQG
ncbi:hypothetical protein WJX84_006926 [Apatococcus fuscideae]|uniref:Uncharacterized protein n=1 Tax=Apatococcus fuscideae TaxID=2026836 RepID=A0AAW1T9M6_9CHLO